MKIVVITSRFPYPIEKGDKLRMYHQLKGLSVNNEVHLISISHDHIEIADKKHIAEFCASLKVFSISKKRSILNAGLGLFNSKPFQVNYFLSGKIKRLIHSEIERISPEVIYCQLIRMTEYVVDLNYPKVLDFMDAFSLNYKRRSKFESKLRGAFFRIEAKRLARYEKKMMREFDASVIISETDRAVINSGNSIEKISNGLDIQFFRPQKAKQSTDLAFVGNMGYHPNVLAAVFLVEKILPLAETIPSIKIAGARPNSRVLDLISDRVEVTGWVDDIRNAYASAKIFVAPIFSGAGQQNKIMEAMAMEKICIISPIVNEGINARADEEVMIANNAAEFAKLIDKVLRNIHLYSHIGANARKFVAAHFSWDSENKKLEKILLEVAKRT